MGARLVLLAAGLSVVGCGGSDSGEDGSAEGNSLVTGLEGVNYVERPRETFAVTWVDVPRFLDESGLPDSLDEASESQDGRWSSVVGLAIGGFGPNQGFDKVFGFEPLAGERTITTGSPSDETQRFDGVDADGATSAYEEVGFEAGGDFLSLGEEGELMVGDSVDLVGRGPSGFNRVAVDGETLALGSFEDSVEAALGKGGEPVSSAEGVPAASDCLGDAFAARVEDLGELAGPEVALTGFGFGSTEDPTAETLCAVGEPGGSLGEIESCMEGTFNGDAVLPTNGAPYEDILGPAEIEAGEFEGTPWVRAEFTSDDREELGALLEIAYFDALFVPLGGDPLIAPPQGRTADRLLALQDQFKSACSG